LPKFDYRWSSVSGGRDTDDWRCWQTTSKPGSVPNGALLKRPKLLIFDEATSGLDAETTGHFAQTINQLRGKVGTIFIAHQLPRAFAVDAVVQLGVR